MDRRALAIGTLLVAAGWFAACSSDSSSASLESDAGPSLDGSADGLDASIDGRASAGSVDAVILAMSDWRGQLEPLAEDDTSGIPQPYGGLDALAWYFAKERSDAKDKEVLVVTTGGAFGATPPIASASGDAPIVLALNLLGATADTLGVHDFDRGFGALSALLGPASFRVVSTNLAHVADELGPKPVVPMYLFDVDQGRGAVTFAILGLTSTDLADLQAKANFGTIEVRAPLYDEANRAAKNARLLGASVVIALASVGVTGVDATGQPLGPLGDLASRLTGVDLLVGGATDRAVDAITPAGVRVVQTRLRGRTYGRVTLRVRGGVPSVDDVTMVDSQIAVRSGALCDAGADAGPCQCGDAAPCAAGSQCSNASLFCEQQVVTPMPTAEAILDAAAAALQARSDTPMAKAASADGGSAAFSITDNGVETAIGDLVGDALLARYRETGAQIALVESSRIRAGLPSPYTSPSLQQLGRDASAPEVALVFGDAFTVFPVGDAAVVRKLSGQTLYAALERALSRAPAADVGFLQVAGIKLTYSTAADAGSRLKTLALEDGTPIANDGAIYTVVLSDRISAGEDGYAVLSELVPTPSRDLLVDIFADYLKAHGTVTAPPKLARIVSVP